MAGAGTPFVKAGKVFKDLGPQRLANHAVRGLVEKRGVNVETIRAVITLNAISLVIDAVEVVRYLAGDRQETVPDL